MKKFFKKAALFMSISAMTLTTTSCGVEDLLNEDTLGIISNLLGNIFGQGQSVSYQGNATCQYLYGTMTDAGFQTEGQTKEVQLSCTMEAQKSTNAVTVKIPSLTLRQDDTSITLTNVTLYNLAIDENGVLSIDEANTGIDGNILAPDGNTYNFVNAYISRATINENTLTFSGTLYFGQDYSRAFNISFTGAMVQQQNDPTGGFGGFGKY